MSTLRQLILASLAALLSVIAKAAPPREMPQLVHESAVGLPTGQGQVHLLRHAFAQTVVFAGRAITNVGTLFELKLTTGQGSDRPSPRVVWREFFPDHPGPTPLWTADVLPHGSSNLIYLGLSSGESVAVYPINLDQPPKAIPSRVIGASMQQTPPPISPDDTVIRPPNPPQNLRPIRAITLALKDGDLVIMIKGVKPQAVQEQRYSLKKREWTPLPNPAP